MKKPGIALLAILLSVQAFSQQTKINNDPKQKFKEAKEYFQKEQYSLAYPLLKELRTSIKETDLANDAIMMQEIDYYTIASALKQNEERAVEQARTFIDVQENAARVQMMNFHLAEYYFRTENYPEALNYYNQANIANLSNREIADMKFHQGYSYFTLQRFNEARPLFDAIRRMPEDPNYIPANYYYGFLAFRNRNYTDALQSFRVVENEPEYAPIVPYYIAQIYYVQGKKDDAIAYAEQKLKEGNAQYYDLELKQLLGHAYFEKKDYAKALIYLEDYVDRSEKVRREDLYELSYSYYMANRLPEAIEGFRQLSGKEDSLSQHAMYLLGDAYLRTNQKPSARNAFLFSASNSSNESQREIARFIYAKLSYELGYQDEALNSLRSFLADYPSSNYNTEARELLVAVLANTNNYRDALVLLESLQQPSLAARRLYPRILFGRATELINDGALAEAETLIDKALSDPNNASVKPLLHFWKGELSYRSDNLDAAIRNYHAYIDGGAPVSGEANLSNARYNLGYSYLRKENYDAALTYFEPLSRNAALNSGPVTQDAYIRTADCYYMNRNYSRASAMYDNVIRYSWPMEDYATFQKAMIAGINNSNEKISLLNNVIRKFPASSLVADANMEIASTFLATERFREAIPYLNNVIRLTDNASLKPQAYLRLGLAYYNLGSNTEALNQYRILVTQYPNSMETESALLSVRSIYIEEGKAAEYAEFMRQAGRPLSVNAEDSLTWAAAINQLENGNTNAALNAFNNYVQRFPEGTYVVDAQFYRGEIYAARKDWPNALSGYEQVAAKAPNRFAEKAVLQAARIYFFEIKDYAKSENYFLQLKQIAAGQENRLEAMRGLLRAQYQQEKWVEAAENAKELLTLKGSSTDDKALAAMTVAKSHQLAGEHELAMSNYKTVVSLNKSALAAEARYGIAASWYALNKLSDAEKAAFEVINKSGSYDYWVTKAYILLGDIFFKQEDYFNAKATFQSIVENSINPDLKAEAQRKLEEVIKAESESSKIGDEI